MKNITITRTKNTVSATYLPYAAYKSAIALATAHKGEIGKTAEGNFKATFASAKIAEQFKSEWTAEYNANRKADAPAPKSTPAQKPKASKGKVVVTVDGKQFLVDASALVPTQAPKTSSTKKATTKKTASKKPTASKGKAFDFTQIKGKTNADKNKALHAALVGMGMKDSRTADYKAVWNARPWAN
jgi:hypothetical protein